MSGQAGAETVFAEPAAHDTQRVESVLATSEKPRALSSGTPK